jgi:hypothetical protein
MQNTNWIQVVRSVIASMTGIQSDKNRQQDFAGGNPGAFIVAGIVAVFLFIGLLIFIVSLVV